MNKYLNSEVTSNEFYTFIDNHKSCQFTDREMTILEGIFWAKNAKTKESRKEYKDNIEYNKKAGRSTKYKVVFEATGYEIVIKKLEDEYYTLFADQLHWPYFDKFIICDQWIGLLEEIQKI